MGLADRAQTMGDDQCGPSFHQTIQGVLYDFLTFVVEGRGGFVEEEDSRILEKSPGDGQA